jgi:hypothetical protein
MLSVSTEECSGAAIISHGSLSARFSDGSQISSANLTQEENLISTTLATYALRIIVFRRGEFVWHISSALKLSQS